LLQWKGGRECRQKQRPAASPPPWSVEETDACFIVRDQNGQALRLSLLRGRARTVIGGGPRRGAAHRRQHRQAVGDAKAAAVSEKMTTDNDARASDLFLGSAIHYYVTGRFAVFARFNPTAANLLHHAVEMSLKGALAKRGMNLCDLRDLNHNLPKIWRVFQSEYGVNLSNFVMSRCLLNIAKRSLLD
jgi:hypothetical protein